MNLALRLAVAEFRWTCPMCRLTLAQPHHLLGRYPKTWCEPSSPFDPVRDPEWRAFAQRVSPVTYLDI